MKKNKPYLPDVRTCYHPTDAEVSGYGQDETSHIANPAVDDIVVNNIAWQEFDYTEDLYNADSSVLPVENDNPHDLNFSSKEVLGKNLK